MSKGESIIFGTYNDIPVKWRVLAKVDEKILLITERILLLKEYHSERGFISWKNCDMRNKTLTSLHVSMFSKEQRGLISTTYNTSSSSELFMSMDRAIVEDKLFLLSVDDLYRYLPSAKARIAKINGFTTWWWLRSPGIYDNDAACICYGGYENLYGYNTFRELGGVRPALWLNL